MATYNPSTHRWVLTPEEADFTMPLGTTNDGITGNALDNHLIGDGGSNIIDGEGGVDTMSGGAGDDTYNISDVRSQIIEFDNEGSDRVNLASLPRDVEIFYTLPGFVEKLLCDGTARLEHLTGNDLDNQIAAAGAPATSNNYFWIDGGLGADTVIIAAAGHYEVAVDQAGDSVVMSFPVADVLVRSSVSFSLGLNIRGLELTGAGAIDGIGNGLGNTLTGNSAANVLKGLDGDDVLDGGAGADRMEGGAGDDTYVADDAGDLVIEAADEGNDTIVSKSGLSLADFANVENLTVTGSAAAKLVGTAVSNVLVGGAGNDTLDGAGGTDRMVGGAGNDIYVVDSADDAVIEDAGAGIDTVLAAVGFSLAAFANVENLTLTSTASAALTGNGLANILVGNAGNDTLDGGAGADRMEGGAGDDTYIIDNADDVVIEAADGGHDTAIVSLDFRMDRLANVEVLKLADGSTAARVTGGAGADHLIGNSAFNILDGGAGADTLDGGAGSDVYLVDDAADVVIETAGGGEDAVQTTVSYALSNATEVEFLTALGSAAIALTGNALSNTLSGNDGANILHGMDGSDRVFGGAGADRLYGDAGYDTLGGGAGRDSLYGGTGRASQDMFVFDTRLTNKRVARANSDKIYDFGPKYDSIGFDDAAFTNRTIARYVQKKGGATLDHPLKISSAWFRAGDKALDRNDFFIYNAKTHKLYFDPDGSGHKAMVEVASFVHFERHTGTLSAKDLFLV